MEWQPIETAPVDGTFILVSEPGKTPVVAYMSQATALFSNLGWQSVPGDQRYFPTKWASLPDQTLSQEAPKARDT